MVRITTARYYTPSGRLIQRPYDKGLADYIEQGRKDEDPSQIDTTKHKVFHTAGGRIVYGGGGIRPDTIIVPAKAEPQTFRLMSKRLFFEYASDFALKHPELGEDFRTFSKEFQVTDTMMNDFQKLIESEDFELDTAAWHADDGYIRNILRGEIASTLFNRRQYYYAVQVQGDNQIAAARTLFDRAEQIAELGAEHMSN